MGVNTPMKQRVLIPTEDQDGTIIAAHFGRAPFFTLFDMDEDGSVLNKEVRPNTGEHRGGKGFAHDNVVGFSPTIIIVLGMGPRGVANFQSQNIAVLKANSTSIEQVLTAYKNNEIAELTEGCRDARHHSY